MAARAPRQATHSIVSIVGTRPEAIKMGPLVRALALSRLVEQQVILTGQHAGLADAFEGFPAAGILDLAFNPTGLSPGELCECLQDRLSPLLRQAGPDLVLVHGDTTSALAGALAAAECGTALGHVEAGLRSFDLQQPWPEEGNRVRIDRLADLLFAPTADAANNLHADPRVRGCVHVSGNTGIDALFSARTGARPLAADGRKQLLVTCHRRENRGDALTGICTALRTMVQCLPVRVVLPLHSNPHVREQIEPHLVGIEHIRLLDAVDHRAMVRLIEESWAVLTDSGGVQEEAAAIGRPVLVMRDVTERIEAPANLELVGSDARRIVAAVSSLLADEVRYARMSVPSLAFGDGRAAPRIAAIIESALADARAGAAV